ncbi:MAG: Hsp20/alpha crystallin family protein [Candidatus Bathyarchaeia archaeon]
MGDEEETIKRPEEKVKKLEDEAEKHRPPSVASAALRWVGGLLPGLSGVISSLENSEAFRERLEAAEKRIEENIRGSGRVKDVAGIRGANVQYRYSVRPLVDDASIAQRPINVRKVEAQEVIRKREPLVDVFDDKDHLTILAQLPSVQEEDIKLNAEGDTLTISANAGTLKYHKEVALPRPVKPETAKTTFKNGALEVRLEYRK